MSRRTDLSRLDRQLGLYGFVPGSDAQAAHASGFRYVVSHTAIVSNRAMPWMNMTIKDEIYAATCPRGRRSCHRLSEGEINTLLATVRRTSAADARNPQVIGSYVTDDYWTDLDYLLPRVYDAIRASGNKKPVVCALTGFMANKEVADPGYVALSRSMRNYSPRWCDAAMLYAFTPKGTRAPASDYDWRMRIFLEKALAGLTERGFRPRRHLLIGMPQAFRFGPRVHRAAGPMRPQFWSGPSPAQLRQQVVAFCRAGARSLIPYAWDDGSRGTVSELGNDPAMRRGFAAGVKTCRKDYW